MLSTAKAVPISPATMTRVGLDQRCKATERASPVEYNPLSLVVQAPSTNRIAATPPQPMPTITLMNSALEVYLAMMTAITNIRLMPTKKPTTAARMESFLVRAHRPISGAAMAPTRKREVTREVAMPRGILSATGSTWTASQNDWVGITTIRTPIRIPNMRGTAMMLSHSMAL